MKKKRKSFRQITGAVLAIIGLLLVVCTADGSNHEIKLRLTGIALFAIGAYVARMFDFQKARMEKQNIPPK